MDEVLDLVTVRGGFTATCDQPMADLYAEQLRRFPDAVVVLTVRDSGERWAASWRTLMRFVEVQERSFSLSYIPHIRAVGAVHAGMEEDARCDRNPPRPAPRRAHPGLGGEARLGRLLARRAVRGAQRAGARARAAGQAARVQRNGGGLYGRRRRRAVVLLPGILGKPVPSRAFPMTTTSTRVRSSRRRAWRWWCSHTPAAWLPAVAAATACLLQGVKRIALVGLCTLVRLLNVRLLMLLTL